jgi:hypothetical protein
MIGEPLAWLANRVAAINTGRPPEMSFNIAKAF